MLGTARNGLVTLAPWFTANVALWPEVDVLLVNPARLASLTSQQREWLAEAASAASKESATRASDDGAYVREDCAAGARFVDATSSDLAAIRRSLAVVYRQIQSDPQTKSFIEQIQSLKRSTPHGPVIRVTGPARIEASPRVSAALRLRIVATTRRHHHMRPAPLTTQARVWGDV